MKTLNEIKAIIKRYKKEIRKKYKAEIIGIFGSYVRGQQKKKSDLDVLVKFYKGVKLFEFVGLAIYLEKN